jgi:hypothetical protein
MKRSIGFDVDRANQEAFERFTKSEPILVDVRPALEVVPVMTRETCSLLRINEISKPMVGSWKESKPFTNLLVES